MKVVEVEFPFRSLALSTDVYSGQVKVSDYFTIIERGRWLTEMVIDVQMMVVDGKISGIDRSHFRL